MKPYHNLEEIRKFFTIEQVITTLGELESFLANSVQNNENCYWRGLNDASYAIMAKSWIDYQNKGLYNIYDNYYAYLSAIYEISQQIRQGALLKIYNQITQFDKGIPIRYNPIWAFSIIQHYATGTPLIDWTNNIWSALFFAWYRGIPSPKTSHTLSDYVQLNSFRYNTAVARPAVPSLTEKDSPSPKMVHIDTDCMPENIKDIREKSSKCIYYVDSVQIFTLNSKNTFSIETSTSYKNPRIDIQNGFFILHLEDISLESKWNTIFKKDNMPLHKVLIHKSLLPQIECLLKDYWGDDMVDTLFTKEKMLGYDLTTIAESVIQKAQSKAKF